MNQIQKPAADADTNINIEKLKIQREIEAKVGGPVGTRKL